MPTTTPLAAAMPGICPPENAGTHAAATQRSPSAEVHAAAEPLAASARQPPATRPRPSAATDSMRTGDDAVVEGRLVRNRRPCQPVDRAPDLRAIISLGLADRHEPVRQRNDGPHDTAGLRHGGAPPGAVHHHPRGRRTVRWVAVGADCDDGIPAGRDAQDPAARERADQSVEPPAAARRPIARPRPTPWPSPGRRDSRPRRTPPRHGATAVIAVAPGGPARSSAAAADHPSSVRAQAAAPAGPLPTTTICRPFAAAAMAVVRSPAVQPGSASQRRPSADAQGDRNRGRLLHAHGEIAVGRPRESEQLARRHRVAGGALVAGRERRRLGDFVRLDDVGECPGFRVVGRLRRRRCRRAGRRTGRRVDRRRTARNDDAGDDRKAHDAGEPRAAGPRACSQAERAGPLVMTVHHEHTLHHTVLGARGDPARPNPLPPGRIVHPGTTVNAPHAVPTTRVARRRPGARRAAIVAALVIGVSILRPWDAPAPTIVVHPAQHERRPAVAERIEATQTPAPSLASDQIACSPAGWQLVSLDRLGSWTVRSWVPAQAVLAEGPLDPHDPSPHAREPGGPGDRRLLAADGRWDRACPAKRTRAAPARVAARRRTGDAGRARRPPRGGGPRRRDAVPARGRAGRVDRRGHRVAGRRVCTGGGATRREGSGDRLAPRAWFVGLVVRGHG